MRFTGEYINMCVRSHQESRLTFLIHLYEQSIVFYIAIIIHTRGPTHTHIHTYNLYNSISCYQERVAIKTPSITVICTGLTQIFIVMQVLETSCEFDIHLQHLFIDFKQVHVTVTANALCRILGNQNVTKVNTPVQHDIGRKKERG